MQTTLTAEKIDRYTAEGLVDRPDHHRRPGRGRRRAPRTGSPPSPRARRSPTASSRRRSVRVALGLLELGVRPGDVVSYQLPNWTEFLVLHHAATRIGAVNNPLIPIYRDREVGFMVGLAESKVLVVPQEFRGFDYPAMVERLRAAVAGPAARARRRTDPARGRSSPARRGRSAATPPSWPRCARTRTTPRC